jgi:hypothetical protein
VTAKLLEDIVRTTIATALRNHPGFTGAEDTGGSLDEAESRMHDAERELEDLTSDIGLRRTLGAERFRRLAESAVAAVEAAQADYREAAGQAERPVTLAAVELLGSADAEELGELLRGVLEAVVVQRGRTPLAHRVKIIPKGSPSEVWLPASQDADSGQVKARKRDDR